MAEPTPEPLAARTPWVHTITRPVRAFVQTEVGSAAVLLAAALAALLWANLPWGDTYEAVWSSELSIGVAGADLSLSLREWINSGLMTLFFFVIGLEIRREFDMGELRERRRVVVPVVAAVGGMAVPALIYVAFTADTPYVHGWGIVMATDTAFALGVLGLVGRRWAPQVRVFLLTLVIVDDVGALLVIALAYTTGLTLLPLLIAAAVFAVIVALRNAGVLYGQVYFLLGIALWLALFYSGVHPTLAGVAMGLLMTAHPPSWTQLQRAASLWRMFREQPTSRYARWASRGVRLAISPNERLQQIYHPWTSYVIVPLFALANAGLEISGDLLRAAVTSPITLGILVGLVAGKTLGVAGASWAAVRLGGLPLSLPWPALIGAAAVAGIGFTVSLFIAEFTFDGVPLREAQVGILGAALLATAVAWGVFHLIDLLPPRLRSAAPTAPAALEDLSDPVDPELDHVRGPREAKVTLVEYGDFECPYCGRAEPVIRELLSQFGTDLRFVFRHLPLPDVHPNAERAAEAAEAAAAEGRFWQMHDLLFEHQDALGFDDLLRYAGQLGLDVPRFAEDLRNHTYAPRVARDVASAEQSGATGTPTFFANGRRHDGPFDLDSLAALVRSRLAEADRAGGPDRRRRRGDR